MKFVVYKLYLNKHVFKNKIKLLSNIQTLKELIAETHTKRHVRRSPLSRRKMIKDGNMDLHNDRKNRNRNHMSKYIYT